MLIFPDWLKPVIYSIPVPFIGQLDIRWYGLMYAVGFLAFWWLGIIHAKKNHTVAKPEEVGDILFYGMLGVILGGRIGSVLFYNFSHFLENPLYLFKIWEGGMSFHGGLLGVIITLGIYQRSKGYGFLRICDFVAPMIPIGLGAGRIGNFINAELWGRVTDVPWGMVFPGDSGCLVLS